jgi:hypothetical protein
VQAVPLFLDNDVESRDLYGMFSRYRRASVLSTLAAVHLVAGCPDPGARFDEFAARVPDAQLAPEGCPTPSMPALPMIPDVSGSALFALKIAFLGTLPPIQLIANQTLTRSGNTAELDLTLQFLTRDRAQLVGDVITVNDVAVAPSGELCFRIEELSIPGEASPTGSAARAEAVIVSGRIVSADLGCGDASGTVTMPVRNPLTGSTWGNQRIQAGQMGAQLPTPPVFACP